MMSLHKFVSFTISIVPSVELLSTMMISLGYITYLSIVSMAAFMVPASFNVGITTETISTFDVIS